ncbi:MAG: tripartite tricarboxylate transporter permease [Gammaproteobacteria bacterium]|nr:tripartite tricarboxylate transporter permease [Gammaproteobacteria bacterium]
MLEHLPQIFAHVFSLSSIIAMVLGVLGGVAIGAMPGVSATMAIAMLLPLTFTLEPVTGLGMIAGIYSGAIYGGAIPAILLRIPGTPAAIATTFDGYPMSQQGQAGRALEISCYSSSLGGMMGALALILIGPPLSRIALSFGPPEMFWVALLGILSLALLLGDDAIKGLVSAGIGLFLACVGTDLVTGQERYAFGAVELVGGLDIAVVLIGLFAIPPTLEMAEKSLGETGVRQLPAINRALGLFAAIKQFWKVWLSGSAIGVLVGILPGAGGNLAAIISYNETKRRAADPTAFGQGKPEGVAAAECANNADCGAALIPALTLGVPGSTVAALIMGALMIHGMQPGPQLLREQPVVVYGLMFQMLVTAALIIPLGGLLATRLFARVLLIPGYLLAPLILSLTVAGVYSINNSTFDVGVLFTMGILGYVMERLGVPLAPASLALILGPLLEKNLMISLVISRNDPSIFFTRPVSLVIIALIVLLIGAPLLRRRLRNRRLKGALEID